MNDLFEPTDTTHTHFAHGKMYTLRPVKIDKVESWAIKWHALDGSAHGGFGGYYSTPELAWAAVDRHPEAMAAMKDALRG